MAGPFTFVGLDTSAGVTPISPNIYNKAPLLVLWLYATTNWDFLQSARQADIQQIADSLNTTYDTVDTVFTYALTNPAFFQSASLQMQQFNAMAYSGSSTQKCLTSPSIPKLAAAAAATWEATS
jgi:hypothetical protein